MVGHELSRKMIKDKESVGWRQKINAPEKTEEQDLIAGRLRTRITKDLIAEVVWKDGPEKTVENPPDHPWIPRFKTTVSLF